MATEKEKQGAKFHAAVMASASDPAYDDPTAGDPQYRTRRPKAPPWYPVPPPTR